MVCQFIYEIKLYHNVKENRNKYHSQKNYQNREPLTYPSNLLANEYEIHTIPDRINPAGEAYLQYEN